MDNINLGIRTFLNGQLLSNIVIDTSTPATDPIDYVATDQSGNTAASIRTVIIQAAANTPIGLSTASSTEASSTPQ